MPSWNIHVAHVEDALAHQGSLARIVRDRNAFLFGSMIPDIFVGYMVPGVEDPIPYRITHFATPAHIPKPREGEFWDTYVAPAAERLNIAIGDGVHDSGHVDGSGYPTVPEELIDASSISVEQDYVSRAHYPQRYEGAPAPSDQTNPLDNELAPHSIERSVFDMVLGCWMHLVADNHWNTRVNEFLDRMGDRPNEQFRIKKQTDFDTFGKTLKIKLVPRPTPRLVETAARFPQYAIPRDLVLMTVGVVHETVRTNPGHAEHDPYLMLTDEFFSQTFAETNEMADRLVRERLS